VLAKAIARLTFAIGPSGLRFGLSHGAYQCSPDVVLRRVCGKCFLLTCHANGISNEKSHVRIDWNHSPDDGQIGSYCWIIAATEKPLDTGSHSNIGTTLNVYTQAMSEQNRVAHERVVGGKWWQSERKVSWGLVIRGLQPTEKVTEGSVAQK